jgi:alanyl-tRNA synthetase
MTSKNATSNLEIYLNQAKDGNLIVETNFADPKSLKAIVDACSDQIDKTVIFINVSDKIMVLIKTKDPLIHAGNLIKNLSSKVSLQGGGNLQFAQAGSKEIQEKEKIKTLLKEALL